MRFVSGSSGVFCSSDVVFELLLFFAILPPYRSNRISAILFAKQSQAKTKPVRTERVRDLGILTLRTLTDYLEGVGARRPCVLNPDAAVRGPNHRTPQ